jgi:hypothetical protein
MKTKCCEIVSFSFVKFSGKTRTAETGSAASHDAQKGRKYGKHDGNRTTANYSSSRNGSL